MISPQNFTDIHSEIRSSFSSGNSPEFFFMNCSRDLIRNSHMNRSIIFLRDSSRNSLRDSRIYTRSYSDSSRNSSREFCKTSYRVSLRISFKYSSIYYPINLTGISSKDNFDIFSIDSYQKIFLKYFQIMCTEIPLELSQKIIQGIFADAYLCDSPDIEDFFVRISSKYTFRKSFCWRIFLYFLNIF